MPRGGGAFSYEKKVTGTHGCFVVGGARKRWKILVVASGKPRAVANERQRAGGVEFETLAAKDLNKPRVRAVRVEVKGSAGARRADENPVGEGGQPRMAWELEEPVIKSLFEVRGGEVVCANSAIRCHQGGEGLRARSTKGASKGSRIQLQRQQRAELDERHFRAVEIKSDMLKVWNEPPVSTLTCESGPTKPVYFCLR
jgi:hypothetical protein